MIFTSPTNDKEAIEIKNWWKLKRRAYNRMLIRASIFAYILFVILVWLAVGESIITVSTAFSHFIVFLIFVSIANVLYFLGQISESMIKPSNKDGFRKYTYGIGYWFSFFLPMSIPLSMIVLYFLGVRVHLDHW